MPSSSSLAEYLAKNYLTADDPSSSKASTDSNPDFADPERPKKKRKKHKTATEPETTGLIIADDDPPTLNRPGNVGQGLNGRPDEEEDEYSPYVVGAFGSASSGLFQKKKKKVGWKKIGPGDGSNSTTGGGSEQDEADRIIASAAAESAARQDADNAEDAPAVIDGAGMDIDDDEGAPRMESGARGGLQTAAQTAAMVAAQERRKKAESAAIKAAGEDAAAQETIYRDASGRIINVAMKRAEARRAADEEREKEERKKEALMGDVQRQQKELRRQELQEAKVMPLARTIEDEAMNDELRARERWNDPAAQFLTTKKSGKSSTGKPLYTGAFAPNRYGIRPGHRWDGVDRSTGFEKEWFQARARKERVGALEYAWQMDE